MPADSSRLLTHWIQNHAELPPRLIPIRKMIAETCGGVPSILLSASNKLKSIRKTQVAWQHVLTRFDLVFYADRLLLDAAYVSYKHLPSSIQQCFLYCSLFLVHSFTPEQLTDMFIADELIKLTSSKSDMHLHFSKIVTEHFYDVMQKSRYKGYTVYKMHPGMQLLAQRISGGFHLAIDARREIIWPSYNARCLSLLVDCETSKLPPELFEFASLRTLILLRDENMLLSEIKCAITDIPAELCQRLTALRVLHMPSCRITRIPRVIDMLQQLTHVNLSHNDIEIVPESISSLRFLAHINLSRTEIAELPESVGKMQSLRVLDLSHCEKLLGLHETISNLVNLQSLNLEGCHYLAVLPRGMKNLKSLAYLNILECPLLSQMPRQMNQLTSIEVMPRYIAAETPKRTISELRSLVNLKELGVHNIENSSSADARNVILQGKRKLESLALSWTGNCIDPEASSRAQEILEHLKPSRGLKVLQIFSYPGRKYPSWIDSRVPYLKLLTDIKLVKLACESLPPLGQLPLLKIVEVSGIDAAKYVDDTFCGSDGTFPSLEKLSFSHMPNLETWLPSHREALFPRLQELAITQCPKFTAVHVKLQAVKRLIMMMNNEKLIACGGSLQGLSRSLTSLSISMCEELLECSQCEGLHELHGLEELHISRCTELISLPYGMQHLSFLRSLTITKCTKLETLPEWLKDITSLRSLCISDCPKLQVPKSLNNLSYLQISLE
jgi:structure-specific endonuclease subunit SLX1